MPKPRFLCIVAIPLLQASLLYADQISQIKKTIERCTLNQPGTKPFHLKASIAPSFERDEDSGRTGEVEIWWASPDKWKREIRSPEFHQVEIFNGGEDWQNNEGSYLPEWLRETAMALINPVPDVEEVLQHAKDAEWRQFHLQTKQGPLTQLNIDWVTNTGTAELKNIQRSGVALNPDTGVLLYTNGFGWGGEFKDYEKFHGVMVARTVNHGSPQVTAKVVVLEDLGDLPANFFQATTDGNSGRLQTKLISETDLRKNLETPSSVTWPPLRDGVLEGNVTSWILVDREGRVRETDGIVSENSGINEAGRLAIINLHFKPFLVNGNQVQVYSQITLPFKTTRPAGMETFDTARNYFDRGRKSSYPAAAGKPYRLQAEFDFAAKDGQQETGHYEDIWLSDERWVRRAELNRSQCVRSRDGDKRYRWVEGEQGPVFCLVLRILEPIPALDTFTESDWRIRREPSNGVSTLKIVTGYESPEGKLDAGARSYWFDETGTLVRAYFNGIESRRSDIEEFNGIRLARRIDVLKDGKLAMRIRVTNVGPPPEESPKIFELKGHEWQRAFTDEVR